MKFEKLFENIIQGWHPVPEDGWRYLTSSEIIQTGDERYDYIRDEWVDDEKVLKIEKGFLEAVKMDIMEEESNFLCAFESWNGD